MTPKISRRRFVSRSAGALLLAGTLPIAAIEPFKRTGPPRIRSSLVAYSLRDSFKFNAGKVLTDPQKSLDLFQFVDYCATHGWSAAELTGYYFPPDVTDEYLQRLRRHCFLANVEVSGTSVGNNFTLPEGEKRNEQIATTKKWIDRAAVLGAPYLRVFAGTGREMTQPGLKQLCIAALQECADHAGTRGVMLGMENHGGIDAAETLEILRAVRSPWFALNLDVGNFQTDDPYADLEKCAPYAINVHWKNEIKPRGKENEPADFKRLAKILRDANYQGYAALEYEAKPDPWKAVPELRTRMQETFGG